jgi:capsular exopolysaccharide synthesis family protein
MSMNDGNRGGREPVRQQAYLRDFWHFIQRNRFLALGIPVLTVLATLGFVQLATPIYEADTQIRVDDERGTLPVLDVLRSLSSGGGSKIHTEMGVLRTRVIAEDVVDSLSLHVEVRSPRRVPRSELFWQVSAQRSAPEGSYRLERVEDGFRVADGAGAAGPAGSFVAAPGEPISLPGVRLVLAPAALEHDRIEVRVRPFARTVQRFRRAVRVQQPNREADLIAVTYQAPDPRLARDVPMVMAHRFIDRRQEGKSAEARATVAFLDDQIVGLAGQLEGLENQLLRFREENRLISVEEEAKAEIERLARLQGERDALNAERVAIARTLERMGAGDDSAARRLMYFPTLLRSQAAAEVMVSLTELENRRANLLELRTPKDPEVVALSERIEALERDLAGNALAYVDGLSNQVQALDQTLGRFRTELDAIPAQQIQLARLEREAGLLEETYLMLETRRKQGEIAAAVTDHTVQVVDPAVVPTEPVRPRKVLSLLMAGILGMVVGFGAAFGREQMDNRVRSRDDLRIASGTVPILGTIPRFVAPAERGWRDRVAGRRNGHKVSTRERLVTGNDPLNPVSEAYRTLRTNITFSRLEKPPRTIVFTSAMPGDGKSTSASNLAITLAQQGLSCVLVDADLRRGVLNKVFGAPREPGLSNVLLRQAALDEVVQVLELDHGDVALRFIPSGVFPPNPAELMASERIGALLRELEDRYDTIILDAPPLNLVTDAALLGTHADGVIVVARSGVTDRAAVEYALSQLEAVRAPVLGTILNDVDVKKERYYGGAYATAASYYGAG